MALVPLTNSDKFAIVDDEDVVRVLLLCNWHIQESGYVQMNSRPHRLLHSVVMRTEAELDHKDQNKLNCQKSNLRFVTRGQNVQNRNKKPGLSSKYLGVVRTRNGTWRAKCGGKAIGTYDYEWAAALAYNEQAKKLYGTDAKLNEVETG